MRTHAFSSSVMSKNFPTIILTEEKFNDNRESKQFGSLPSQLQCMFFYLFFSSTTVFVFQFVAFLTRICITHINSSNHLNTGNRWEKFLFVLNWYCVKNVLNLRVHCGGQKINLIMQQHIYMTNTIKPRIFS